jgi:hypothetical protein
VQEDGRRAKEHDEEKVRDWVRETLPDIKKLNEAYGVLVLEDKSGLSLIP